MTVATRLAACRLIGFLAVACLSGLSRGAEPSHDDDSQSVLSGQQIESALKPPRTRSFVPRGLQRSDAPATDQSVNLNIPFDRDSSALKAHASAQLRQLELALTSASLGRDRFLVAGHTDIKGNPRHNKQLSLRRAEAVKHFLIANGMDAKRLQAVGYGAERLLTPDRPEDSRNRRVEIRDLGESAR